MKVEINQEKLMKLYWVAFTYQLRRSGGLAGQAFTSYTCLRCDEDRSHPNTNTPILCGDCMEKIREENRSDVMLARNKTEGGG